MSKINFISGLPRSGSTLLSALLRQNPRFHAGIQSPLAELTSTVLEKMGAVSEHYPFFDDEKRNQIFSSLFSSYYHDMSDKSVIFDTNRTWTARLHQLALFFNDFKVICCVRNPAWVMDSMELIYRKNSLNYSKMYSSQSRQNVFTRCDSQMNISGTVGAALAALQEAYYGEHSERLLLIDFDMLTKEPKKVLRSLYQFLGEEYYEHDINNLAYSEESFDRHMGVNGLHQVKKQIEFKARRTILPPELFAKYNDMAFWNKDQRTDALLITSSQNL